jgi:hypothetical protein
MFTSGAAAHGQTDASAMSFAHNTAGIHLSSIGNMMTEQPFPTALQQQDVPYFAKGERFLPLV